MNFCFEYLVQRMKMARRHLNLIALNMEITRGRAYHCRTPLPRSSRAHKLSLTLSQREKAILHLSACVWVTKKQQSEMKERERRSRTEWKNITRSSGFLGTVTVH